MKFIKLYENYFKDKKIIEKELKDLDEKYRSEILDDLADCTDIQSVKYTLSFRTGLYGESDEISILLEYDFKYTYDVLKSLKNFEYLYKQKYHIKYDLYLTNTAIGYLEMEEILCEYDDDLKYLIDCFMYRINKNNTPSESEISNFLNNKEYDSVKGALQIFLKERN